MVETTEYLDPRFRGLQAEDIGELFKAASQSDDPTDRDFAQACVTEMVRRAELVRLFIVGRYLHTYPDDEENKALHDTLCQFEKKEEPGHIVWLIGGKE